MLFLALDSVYIAVIFIGFDLPIYPTLFLMLCFMGLLHHIYVSRNVNIHKKNDFRNDVRQQF